MRAFRSRVLAVALIFGGSGLLGGCPSPDKGSSPSPPPPAPNNNPARVTLSQTGTVTLSSGTTVTVTASVFTSDGRQLSGVAVTWESSSAGTARVDNGTITGVLVGSATITASAGGITSSGLSVSVTPGAAVALGLRTQPAGAAVAIALTTQPVVEIRDAAGNTVTSASAAVTVSLGSGGGTLSGTPTENTVAGVATFSGLTITGVAGSRTLTFAATPLTTVSSASFTLAPGAPVQLRIRTQPQDGVLGVPLTTQPVIELLDVSGNVASGSTITVTAALASGGGSLAGATTVSAVAGAATFRDLAVAGSVGDRTLSFSASPLNPVSSTRFGMTAIIYGTATQKIQFLDPGVGATPTTVAGSTPSYVSHAPSRAAVDNTGRVTGRAEGQSWIVSSVPAGADSVLVMVPRAVGGPILRTNLTTYVTRAGDTTSVDLILDPRSTPVGALSLFVTIASQNFINLSALHEAFVLQPAGLQVEAFSAAPGFYRFSLAAPGSISGPATFGRLRFWGGDAGESLVITLGLIDAYAPDGADISQRVTSTTYPVIVR